jgi:hypothetical protein
MCKEPNAAVTARRWGLAGAESDETWFMNRRVVKNEFEANLEVRPTTKRSFEPGVVLNILQSIRAEMARFTVEGEGIDGWCCPQQIIDEQTEVPQHSTT